MISLKIKLHLAFASWLRNLSLFFSARAFVQETFRGWSGGPKVLGKLPVPGRPTNLDYSRARAYCACSRSGWGLFGHWCWVNSQCRGVLLIWIIVGQGPIVLAVSAGGGLFGHFFSHLSVLFSFSLSLRRPDID